MRGSIIDYTAHMYSIQENTSVWRENAQQEGTPSGAGGCMPGASLLGRPAGALGSAAGEVAPKGRLNFLSAAHI